MASSRVYWLTSLSPAREIKPDRATRGGLSSIAFNDKYSSAISDRTKDLGRKLAMIVAIFTAGASVAALYAPSSTSLKRLENASVSNGAFDRACPMN